MARMMCPGVGCGRGFEAPEPGRTVQCECGQTVTAGPTVLVPLIPRERWAESPMYTAGYAASVIPDMGYLNDQPAEPLGLFNTPSVGGRHTNPVTTADGIVSANVMRMWERMTHGTSQRLSPTVMAAVQLTEKVPRNRLVDLGARAENGNLTALERLAMEVLCGNADVIPGLIDQAIEDYGHGSHVCPAKVVGDPKTCMIVITPPNDQEPVSQEMIGETGRRLDRWRDGEALNIIMPPGYTLAIYDRGDSVHNLQNRTESPDVVLADAQEPPVSPV